MQDRVAKSLHCLICPPCPGATIIRLGNGGSVIRRRADQPHLRSLAVLAGNLVSSAVLYCAVSCKAAVLEINPYSSSITGP